MLEVKNQIKTLKPYQPGKSIDEVKRELGLEKIIKLASNENPYGCSPKVTEALREGVKDIAIYPDGYATSLRAKLANHLNVEEDMLVFGNGSDEVVQIISRSFLAPGTNTVMPTPTFPQYRHNAIIEGAEVREIENVDGRLNLLSMLHAIDEMTRIVWLCSPNNPTGTYINELAIRDFLKSVPQETLVVVDEAYYEYVTAGDYPDTISMLQEYPNLIILRTFSKAYGLASLRVGYGIANSALIQSIEPVREPFNVNSLALIAAEAAINDQEFIKSCVVKNENGMKKMAQFCEDKQLAYFPSQGNFILIDFDTNGDDIFHYLLQKGFIVRSGVKLGYPNAVRITIGTDEQMEELMEVITEWFSLSDKEV